MTSAFGNGLSESAPPCEHEPNLVLIDVSDGEAPIGYLPTLPEPEPADVVPEGVLVHRRDVRADGTITASCLRALTFACDDDEDMRITTYAERVTCPVCRIAEVS